MPRRGVLQLGLLTVGWLCAATVVAAFFLPWARVQVNSAGLGAVSDDLSAVSSFQELAGKLQKKVGRVVVTVERGGQTTTGQLSDLSALPSEVPGHQIPVLARREDTRLVAAIGGLFVRDSETLSPERVRSCSDWVYGVPAVAVLAGLLMTAWRRRGVAAGVGAGCLTLAGLGWRQLPASGVTTFLATVTVGPGLWLSCAAFAALGAVAIALAWLS